MEDAGAVEQPNILLILTDDQRADAIGAIGNTSIETPHIDRIANQGILFSNAYIMGANHGAICAPSRAMLMSGQGLYHVYEDLGLMTPSDWDRDSMLGIYRPYHNALDDKMILPQLLRNNNYTTFATGKWHASRQSFLHGFDQGKEVFFGGMADHFNTLFIDLNSDGTFTKPKRKGFSTDVITNAALDFIKDYSNKKNTDPFFAFVSYTAPHDPRSPAKEYIDYYGENTLPVPCNLKSNHPFGMEGGMVTEKRLNMTIRDEQTGAWPRTPSQVRKQLADYYGLITHIDKSIGRIISSLTDLNLMENTIVIFTSDNGLAMGSHGLLGKQSLYEHSTKVPLIISGPGIPKNSVNKSLVSLLDIFPTICGLTDIPTPQHLDGKSLLSIIRGDQESVRDVMFTTYWDFIRAVRDERWKLITYPLIHHVQLFDLKNDPCELNNLAQESGYQSKVDELMDVLKRCKMEADDQFPMFTKEKYPMEYSLEGFKRTPDGVQPQYVLDKYFTEN